MSKWEVATHCEWQVLTEGRGKRDKRYRKVLSLRLRKEGGKSTPEVRAGALSPCGRRIAEQLKSGHGT